MNKTYASEGLGRKRKQVQRRQKKLKRCLKLKKMEKHLIHKKSYSLQSLKPEHLRDIHGKHERPTDFKKMKIFSLYNSILFRGTRTCNLVNDSKLIKERRTLDKLCSHYPSKKYEH